MFILAECVHMKCQSVTVAKGQLMIMQLACGVQYSMSTWLCDIFNLHHVTVVMTDIETLLDLMRWYLCGYYTISWFCYVVQSPVDRTEGWDQRLLWDYCLEHVPFYLTLGPSSWEQNGELNGTHNNIREREGWFYRENCQRNPNVSNKRQKGKKRASEEMKTSCGNETWLRTKTGIN